MRRLLNTRPNNGTHRAPVPKLFCQGCVLGETLLSASSLTTVKEKEKIGGEGTKSAFEPSGGLL